MSFRHHNLRMCHVAFAFLAMLILGRCIYADQLQQLGCRFVIERSDTTNSQRACYRPGSAVLHRFMPSFSCQMVTWCSCHVPWGP